MKTRRFILVVFFNAAVLTVVCGQGLINNGAHIVVTNGSNIYINTAGTGHYTSQAGGIIDNNSAGATITVGGNWVNNSANVGFSNDGATVVLNGNAQSIGGTNSTTFYNLTQQGAGTKTLNINTGVGGIATLNGVLSLGTQPMNLNSFVLTVSNPNAGAITNTTGYIISETNVALNPSQVKWIVGTTSGAHIIPFGTAAGVQLPLTLNITAAMPTAASFVTASTRATLVSNNTPWSNTVTNMYDPTIGADGSVQAVIDRWWDLTWSAAATSTITFSYRGAENTLSVPYNTGNLGAQYWNAAWIPDNANIGSAPAVMAGVGTVTAPGISFTAATYTPMVLSSVSAPLPVVLTAFSGSCVDNHIVLSWTTGSEQNNHYFTIERSSDGNLFSPVATIAGSGTTSLSHTYSFTDSANIASVTYYRLRQTDFNGNSKVYTPVAVNPCGAPAFYFNAFASGENITVDLDVDQEQKYSVAVLDMTGRTVSATQVLAVKGSNRFELENLNAVQGIYFVVVSDDTGKRFVRKVFNAGQ